MNCKKSTVLSRTVFQGKVGHFGQPRHLICCCFLADVCTHMHHLGW